MKPNLSGYIPTLDGWRSLAILGVLMAHSADSLERLIGGDTQRIATITSYGTLGVDIFFGISGFLICSRLLEEHRKFGRISLRGFYIRRAFRILPPYFLCLAGIAVLSAVGLVAVKRWEWIGCLFFFRNYVPSPAGGWFTGHFWSLAVEEHFYFIWPGLLAVWGIARARRYVIVPAIAIAVWRVAEFRLHLLDRILPNVSFYTRTDVRFDALLWGCLAALLFPEIRDRLGKWLRSYVWIGLVVLFFACAVYKPPFALMWQSAIIPFLLVGTILHPSEWAGRILEWAPLRWIGKLSYSLYLWQQIFCVDAAETRNLGIFQNMPMNLAAVFACACFSYYLVERPAIRLGHRFAKPINAGRDTVEKTG